MRLYNYSTQINRMGGTRAGANMAVLRYHHPDIREFVNSKKDPESLASFNISVMADDEFMHAVARRQDIPLRFGSNGDRTPRASVNAADLFDEIVENAWQTGDPGLLFYDRINDANPTPQLGAIEATNPCGEQPLLPYESCNLGSINVAKFVRGTAIDYHELGAAVDLAIHFLDNVLDANAYPVDAVRSATLGNRKVGLGIMGFADLLVSLGIPYASTGALVAAEEIMRFIQEQARLASAKLAKSKSRGPFPNFTSSRLDAEGRAPQRNACVTSIAPTGTISLLAGCSSGIEPFFALSYRRQVIGATNTVDVNPELVRMLRSQMPDAEAILKHVRLTGRLDDPAVPQPLRQLFLTAHEIAPEWHVRIQAAFQRHIDTSVSKTINLANSAKPSAIAAAFHLAWETRCKGITVFRDGCKHDQVLRAGVDAEHCPECGELLVAQAGCQSCGACGYSICTI
jgi:ribonucleoside-diphosphate reductase alpha chain